MARVLLIDPDTRAHRTLRSLLPESFRLLHHPEPALSVDRVRAERPDLILLEIDLGDFDGIALLRSLVSLPDAAPVVVLTSLRHTRLVVRAVQSGAADYLTKPFVTSELLSALVAALERRPAAGTGAVGPDDPTGRIIGDSRAAREQRRQATLFGGCDAPVMILGESGTGKDLFTRIIHRLSARRTGPCVAVNCGAVPETLFESEMFGVARGAYTDAVDRPGHFEQAQGGTLFLDEIGELSPQAQVKLLRVLEDRRIRRVGSTEERPVDVRIIVASNRLLRADVRAGRFRSDLFYRLTILSAELAPLRERREDIPLLATYFLSQSAVATAVRFSDAALTKLEEHDWPGNVRELKNLVDRAGIVADGGVVMPSDVTFL